MDHSLLQRFLQDGSTVQPESQPSAPAMPWVRIPDGTRVRLKTDQQEGVVDGLTELVHGPGRNPDGRTQYRVNLGDQARTLVVEDDLLVLVDAEGVALMVKQKVEFRRLMTQRLRGAFSSDRFVPAGK